MKKILALILAGALALSLAACGGGSGAGDNTPGTGNGDTTSADTPSSGEADSAPGMTKEEMLEQAEAVKLSDIGNACFDNIAGAKQTYCGKALSFMGEISEIKADSVIFAAGQAEITVFLAEEDIVNLKTNQWITVVGITNDDIIEETMMGFPRSVFTMEQAYLVADHYEHTGTVKSENDSYQGAWNVEFPGSSVLKLVYFDESVDVNQYVGKEITFSSIDIGTSGTFYDAVIVE